MATSGTYVWEMQRDQIITDALRKVGAIDEEASPTAQQIIIGSRTLNGLVKTMAGALGMPLWSIKEVSIPLTASATYSCGIGQTVNIAKPTKILQAWRRTASIDTPVRIISVDEYNQMSSKTLAPAPPVSISYQPDITTGVISVYPLPDAYSISNTTLYIRYHRPFQDFNATADTPDFPSHWDLPLVFHLALALSPDYGVPMQDKKDLKGLADMYTEMAQAQDYENAPFNIYPDTSYSRK